MGPQRWLILMTFVLCSYYVKSQGAEPVQVVYNRKGNENGCYCSVLGIIIQIGMIYKPCDERDLIEGKELVSLTERMQEIVVYSPTTGMYSEVCDTVRVEQELIDGVAKAGFYCEWSSRPVKSHISCVCVTFPHGAAVTKWEGNCEHDSMKTVNLTLGVGNENQTENTQPATEFVDKEALKVAVPFVVGSGTDSTAEITERLPNKSISSATVVTVTPDLLFELTRPTQNVEMFKTTVNLVDQKTSPTQAQKVVIEQNITPSIMKTKKSEVTVIPSIVITEIDRTEIIDDKFVNSLNATEHELTVHEPNSDNENNLLSNVQSIKGKIETMVKRVVCSDPINSDLDMVTNKLKKEVVNEIVDKTTSITKNLCPFNATEVVKTLKRLEEEYEMLKFILGQSFGYVMTAFVSVLLTLCGVVAMGVYLCIGPSSVLKKGENGLTKIVLIQPAEVVSVSSRDQETGSEDESIV